MKKAAVVFITLIVAASTAARTITVDDDNPADFDNIQAAIDDANDGDTIIVADGTYTGDGNRDIDFKGKAIALKSANGPENCIIDCTANEYEPHRAFTFNSGEDGNSVLSGFAITNGYNSDGGGIHCYQASPTIRGCVLTGNYGTRGGGMYNDQGNPSLINCTFEDNDAHDGAGIHNKAGSPMLTACTFRANHARAMYNGHHSSPILTNCEFIENDGGGVENHMYTNPIFTNCKFIGNSAGAGGAVNNNGYDTPMLINCIFLGNVSDGRGGAMHSSGGDQLSDSNKLHLDGKHSGKRRRCNLKLGQSLSRSADTGQLHSLGQQRQPRNRRVFTNL